MTRMFGAFLLLFLCTNTMAHGINVSCPNHQVDGAHFKQAFSLSIVRSFATHYIKVHYCDSSDEATDDFLLVIAEDRNGFDVQHKSFRLSGKDKELVFTKFEEAWDYNKRDSASGMDGAMWCLDTKRLFTRTKGCFWSPLLSSKERGLTGLAELGKFLWSYAGLEAQYGALH